MRSVLAFGAMHGPSPQGAKCAIADAGSRGLVRGNAHQMMLLAEAAQGAGVAGCDATSRPTCAV